MCPGSYLKASWSKCVLVRIPICSPYPIVAYSLVHYAMIASIVFWSASLVRIPFCPCANPVTHSPLSYTYYMYLLLYIKSLYGSCPFMSLSVLDILCPFPLCLGPCLIGPYQNKILSWSYTNVSNICIPILWSWSESYCVLDFILISDVSVNASKYIPFCITLYTGPASYTIVPFCIPLCLLCFTLCPDPFANLSWMYNNCWC